MRPCVRRGSAAAAVLIAVALVLLVDRCCGQSQPKDVPRLPNEPWPLPEGSPSPVTATAPKQAAESGGQAACGVVGGRCCPGDGGSKAWSCKDGSTCIYYQLGDNSKSSRCEAINRACGTGANAPCCPASYERGILYNPALAAPAGCPDRMFCDSSSTGMTCVPNSPDCGAIGKKCCIQTSRVGVYVVCGPSGFCSSAAMAAFKGGGYGPLSSLMCLACPDDKCDASAERRIGIQGHLDKLP